MSYSNFQKPVDGIKTLCALCGVIIKTLAYILFWVFIFGILTSFCTTGVSFSSSMLKANMAAVAARGKDIHSAITNANAERKPLGLPPLWPKTYHASTNHLGDIASMIFTNSSDYFYELYDGPNVATDKHDPYVKGFDYSKLGGAGVPAKSGTGQLLAVNNMWLIAANITDEDSDLIPVLITRNVDVKEIERYINHGGGIEDTKLAWSTDHKAPFGNKGVVGVRKGGGTFSNQAKYVTLRVLFNSQPLPPRDPSKPPIVYLMP